MIRQLTTTTSLRSFTVAVLFLFASSVSAQHQLVTQGNGKLTVFNTDGSVDWSMDWGGIHDIHVLENGNIMVQKNMRQVVEIDRETKKVVWSYDASQSNGNAGKRVEVHAFQPLPNGHVMKPSSPEYPVMAIG